MNSVERVKSICRERKIPISRLEKELNFANGYIGQLKKGTFPDDRLLMIANYLDVPVETLYDDNLLKTSNLSDGKMNILTSKDKKDISAIISDVEELLKQDGLMFDGNPASQEEIESIISAMKIGMEMAKKKNKEKYTPKKYKKDWLWIFKGRQISSQKNMARDILLKLSQI